jgi:hypothetical protein
MAAPQDDALAPIGNTTPKTPADRVAQYQEYLDQVEAEQSVGNPRRDEQVKAADVGQEMAAQQARLAAGQPAAQPTDTVERSKQSDRPIEGARRKKSLADDKQQREAAEKGVNLIEAFKLRNRR